LAEHAKAALPEDEEREPTEDEIAELRERLIGEAVSPLLKADVRNKVLLLQTQTEQIIDIATQDKLLSAGFVDSGEARSVVDGFETWIRDHHDEHIALKAYFDQPYERRPSLADIKELAKTLEAPPLNFTTARLWQAYKKVAEGKVRGDGGRVLTDIVSLIRFAVGRDDELTPHAELVRLRFDIWMAEQQQNGKSFTPEQLGWLMMVRDHIAGSLSIEPDDFDLDPFANAGGLLAVSNVFGPDLQSLLEELNARLGAA